MLPQFCVLLPLTREALNSIASELSSLNDLCYLPDGISSHTGTRGLKLSCLNDLNLHLRGYRHAHVRP